jgi:hypothetical protein
MRTVVEKAESQFQARRNKTGVAGTSVASTSSSSSNGGSSAQASSERQKRVTFDLDAQAPTVLLFTDINL